jgi:hypothetical protein
MFGVGRNMFSYASLKRMGNTLGHLGQRHISMEFADGVSKRVRLEPVKDPKIRADLYEGVRLWKKNQKRDLAAG